MKLKGFLAGLAGGAVAAAVVVLLVVFVFDIGGVDKTIVQATPETPTVYSTPSTTSSGGLTPEQIYSNLSGGVVMVLAEFGGAGTDQFGQPQSGEALGTGFVVDKEGNILTNAHVVDENGQRADSVSIVFNKGGSETQRVKGTLVGVDVGSDVAVIKVDPNGVSLKPLPLGDSDKVASASPSSPSATPLASTSRSPRASSRRRGAACRPTNGQTIPNVIQTDAAINRGNSGGPLIDNQGKVIGINERIASQSGGNEGLGFAIPINTAVRSLEQIKANGKVTYAWMGVTLKTLTSDIAGMFNMQSQGGALVEAVSPGSPAAKAGIKAGDQNVTVQGEQFTIGGDVIVKADNTEIKTADDLIAFLGTKKPGDTVKITVERDGKTQELSVTLAERPSNL